MNMFLIQHWNKPHSVMTSIAYVIILIQAHSRVYAQQNADLQGWTKYTQLKYFETTLSKIHLLKGLEESDDFNKRAEEFRNEREPDIDENKFQFDLSPKNLKILAFAETTIYHLLKTYYEEKINQNLNLDGVEAFQDYKKSIEILSNDFIHIRMKQMISNPILTLRMLIRITLDLPLILKDLNEPKAEKKDQFSTNLLNKTITRINQTIGWPNEYDLDEAYEALLRIHRFYNLKLDDLVLGRIKGKITGAKLESKHCFLIGTYALYTNRYLAQAVEWLEIAKQLFRIEEHSGISESLINANLLEAVKIHDEAFVRGSKDENDYDRFSDYFIQQIVQNPGDEYEFKGYTQRIKLSSREHNLCSGIREQNCTYSNFKALCSGANFQTEEEKSKLHCTLDTHSNPYWKINPLQTEILSNEPFIAQYYNVLPPTMLDEIKEYAEPKLLRSRIYNITAGGSSTSLVRTSFNAWIKDEYFPEDDIISKRIELITNLVVSESSSEPLQIAAYTFGGHYEVHLDADEAEHFYKSQGERIATFMFYLNDVAEGGYTAFPIAGTAAKPVKGSAVFWFNLHGNGNIDHRTFHGACPLILGESKWVANKWIRSNDQFLVAKCKPEDNMKNTDEEEDINED